MKPKSPKRRKVSTRLNSNEMRQFSIVKKYVRRFLVRNWTPS